MNEKLMEVREQLDRDWNHPIAGTLLMALSAGVAGATAMGVLLLVLNVPVDVGVPIAALIAGLTVYPSAYVLRRVGL